jgi:hypothetical protein
VVLVPGLDGERLALRARENTTQPTRGVPDEVWMGLFLGASPMVWGGPPTSV